MKKAGFTLFELLIVMAIIGILTAIGSVSYSSVQQKGRNSRRLQDMKAVQNALEQYYGETGSYPTSGCNVGTTYLPAGLPVDPKNSGIYTYTLPCTSASQYCICAQFEPDNNSYGNADSNACAGLSNMGTGEFYCLRQLQ